MMQSTLAIVASAAVICPAGVSADGFLQHSRTGRFVRGSGTNFHEAMASVMGCGATNADDTDARIADLQNELEPLWRVVPKDSAGEAEWRSMRFMTHRYFSQKHSLIIRGLETARENSVDGGTQPSSKTPAAVHSVLNETQSFSGFSQMDATLFVATMERLMINAEQERLARVYKYWGIPTTLSLKYREIRAAVRSYMVFWMVQGSSRIVHKLLSNRTFLVNQVQAWPHIEDYVDGNVDSWVFARRHGRSSVGQGAMLMQRTFSFDDVHSIVLQISRNFASYWEAECQTIKSGLLKWDKSANGRVTLADFYGANKDGDWRFGESVAYLQELGALEETAWGEKRVIVSNYVQGASNCIVASSHYFVCCKNECEPIMNEIEDYVAEPVANPERILNFISNMSDFEDDPPKLTDQLRSQLTRIAETHGGKVPLHGRLFAQWLHYVFPTECQFPHRAGTSKFKGPADYGKSFNANAEVISVHAALRNSTSELIGNNSDASLLTQWSEDEELIGDYSLELRAPWEVSRIGWNVFGIVVLAFAIATAFAKGNGLMKGAMSTSVADEKAHFV